MYDLTFDKYLCVSCGICMDVCEPRAIDMSPSPLPGVEGNAWTYLRSAGGDNHEAPPSPQMADPYLVFPELCNGCEDCVNQCPTGAVALLGQASKAAIPA